jgi:membrane dipeptidase
VAACLGVLLARTDRDKQVFLRKDVDSATQEITYAMAKGQLAYYQALESSGRLRLIRTGADLKRHWASWRGSIGDRSPLGLILSMEGSDGILGPAQASAWWDDGLRVVSLAHYGQGLYAGGTGAVSGITPGGVELLRELRRTGMILDVTHLSERSFHQALELFDGPVLASHTNCRALVPGER